MNGLPRHLPIALVTVAAIGLAWHGPVAQPGDYHAFADRRRFLGVANAADVLSNVAFAAVATWGILALGAARARAALGAALPGYALFFAALGLTALGSSYYHLAPDDARLAWDRLGIALACAGLLSATYADTHRRALPALTVVLALAAMGSVWWWTASGDLRPYVLLQAAPLVLIPIWQWNARRPRPERAAFGAAIALYLCAKGAELADAAIFEALGVLSGHTLKHLLAAAASAAITWSAIRRARCAQDA